MTPLSWQMWQYTIICKSVVRIHAEHSRCDYFKAALASAHILDRDMLHLGRLRERIVLRKHKYRSRYAETALRLVLDHGMILTVRTERALYVLPHVRREEYLTVILDKVELPVRRIAVFLLLEHRAGRGDLLVRMSAERSAAESINRALRCRYKRIFAADPVSDEKVYPVMRRYLRGLKIDNVLAVAAELACGAEIFSDSLAHGVFRRLAEREHCAVARGMGYAASEHDQVGFTVVLEQGRDPRIVHKRKRDRNAHRQSSDGEHAAAPRVEIFRVGVSASEPSAESAHRKRGGIRIIIARFFFCKLHIKTPFSEFTFRRRGHFS